MRAINEPSAGFSLVETMIAVGLLGIIGLGTATLLQNMLQGRNTDQFRRAVATVHEEIRSQLAVSNPLVGSSNACTLTFAGLTMTPNKNLSVKDLKNHAGATGYAVGQDYGDRELAIKSILLSTGSGPTDIGSNSYPPIPTIASGYGKLTITYLARKSVLGGSEITRSIDLKAEKNVSTDELVSCVPLSRMSDGIWLRAGAHDIYFNDKVAIGNSSPAYNLDLTGDLNLTGLAYINKFPALAIPEDGTTVVGNTGLALTKAAARFLTSVGYNALSANTAGRYNDAFGADSLRSNTSGSFNSAFGTWTLKANTTGGGNTAAGFGALAQATTGKGNTALGATALTNVQSGVFNTGIGGNAGYQISVGNANTFLGESAGYFATTGSNNVLIGANAGKFLTTGSSNIVIGSNSHAGLDIDGNIIIGNSISQPAKPSLSRILNIGNLIFGMNVDGSGTALSTGNVGIGVRAPTAKLEVLGNGPTIASFSNGTQSCAIGPTYTGGILCSSDERLKLVKSVVDPESSLDKLEQLRSVIFEWKGSQGELHVGYLASEVQHLFPSLVTTASNGFKQVDYSGMVPYITSGISRVKALLDEQSRLLELQQKEITDLKARLLLLERQRR